MTGHCGPKGARVRCGHDIHARQCIPEVFMRSYLFVKQVRERLNNSTSTRLVYKLIEKGKLRVNRTTGKVLVLEESLEQLLESGEALSGPPGTPGSDHAGASRPGASTPTRSS